MARFSQIRFSSGRPGYGAPPRNPLARILAVLGGVMALGLSIFVGAVFIAALVGLLLIGSIILLCRGWWLRRKMERYARETGDLDAEYTVIKEDIRRRE